MTFARGRGPQTPVLGAILLQYRQRSLADTRVPMTPTAPTETSSATQTLELTQA